MAVVQALKGIQEAGLTLGLLVDFISFRTESKDVAEDQLISAERASLICYDNLPDILDRWRKRHRGHGYGRARKDMLEWAINNVNEQAWREMDCIKKYLESNESGFELEHIIKFNPIDMIKIIQDNAHTVWSILQNIAWLKRQVLENRTKSPNMTILMMVSAAAYCSSNEYCQLQQLLSLDMRANGVPVWLFDAFHALGISMSYSWSSRAIDMIGKRQLELVQQLASPTANNGGVLLLYDNINQCENNRAETDDSGVESET
ncbi:uncharacterized protein EI90DRAFT_3126996 [Cantharellus anzutake]|uniref:uncharacterized protein n=1 Tax=Cantharellus anzutake TaxID=1750568 RepID=UPI00190453D2|nr:uncharacterized protein EI90DRAFT_3126996 [Cantharellus anzutake]KAF8327369.1 hypothetical protein EI90DRAFT_3126996 [Cantharellus anzutake]